MPKLILKKKAEVLCDLPLSGGQFIYKIGSDEDNDLVVEDKLVSGVHARIENHNNRFFVQDLQSAFGTYVNGERIEGSKELFHGDALQLGEHTILFDNPLQNLDVTVGQQEAQEDNGQANGSAGTPSAASLAADEKQLRAMEEAIRRESLALGGQTRGGMAPYYLLAIYGPYTGKRFQLRFGETKIGRDATLNDIILSQNNKGEPDQSISRRHATIIYKDNAFFVTDKRSKTRTRVNQELVPEDGEIEIFPGDEIEIISDQESTIFRFVDESNLDFSPPKKAGVWWVRYRSRFFAAAATAALLAGLFLLVQGFRERSVIVQRPEPLSFELTYWSSDRSMTLDAPELSSLEIDQAFQLVPAVADFDGDGFVDIASTNVTNKPVLIDGRTQSVKWIVDTLPANPNASLTTADLNQNGLSDVVYVSNDGRLVAIDGKLGAEIWTSPFYTVPLLSPPVVADFDGDGLPDVAAVDENGDVHIGYNRVLETDWATVSVGLASRAPLSGADLDLDGDTELLVGTERGIVFIIDGNKRVVSGTLDVNEELNRALGTFYEDNQIRFPVGAADLNGDQVTDLIVSTAQGRILAVDGATRHRLWHDLLSDQLTLEQSYSFPFAIGDLDGDRLPDVVVGTQNGEIRAYKGTGDAQERVLLWSQAAANPVMESFALGDVNKDKAQDVVFVATDGALAVLNGRTGESLFSTGQWAAMQTSIPFIADLQNDALLDIIRVTKPGIIFQYKSNCRVPKQSILWGEQFGGPQNALLQAVPPLKTATANLSMAFGFLLFSGGLATIFLNQRKGR
ncbi:MAG: FHA domain-containing protein [Calditrichaeota bacterium]|nr:MAG: FHA domain-containing protein [Calditrichota bacterium]